MSLLVCLVVNLYEHSSLHHHSGGPARGEMRFWTFICKADIPDFIYK